MKRFPRPIVRRRGFTLLELMVSMSVLAIIMLLVFQMLGSTQRAWGASRARLSTYTEARVAFEGITRRLSQAMLNTYYDYDLSGPATNPTVSSYKKQSDLHFVCGRTGDLLSSGSSGSLPGHAVFFQAPVGFSLDVDNQPLNHLLNSWGYYVEYNDGLASAPNFLKSEVAMRERFRLMEFRPPAEDLAIYKVDLKNATKAETDAWYSKEVGEKTGNGTPYSRPIAENVLLLVIEPKESEAVDSGSNALAPDFEYDSRGLVTGRGKANNRTQHVLPPILEVTMVAIDEESAVRYEQVNGPLNGIDFSGLFKSTTAYKQDLITLERLLADARIDYRVFHETVAIKASNWNADFVLP